jgi:hypothetical protein
MSDTHARRKMRRRNVEMLMRSCRACQKRSNPLPAAKSRRPFCFRRPEVILCSLTSSGRGSPAAVADVHRSA